MDDQRKAEIEKRLREIREERLCEASVQSLSLSNVELCVGNSATVISDRSTFEAAERSLSGSAARDVTKSVYLSERGTITAIHSRFQGVGPAVQLKFVDGVSKWFLTSCLVEAQGAAGTATTKKESESLAQGTKSLPPPKHVNPSDSIHLGDSSGSVAISMPEWGSLRRPGSKSNMVVSVTSSAIVGKLRDDKVSPVAVMPLAQVIAPAAVENRPTEDKSVSALPEPKKEADQSGCKTPGAGSTPRVSALPSLGITPRTCVAAEPTGDDMLLNPDELHRAPTALLTDDAKVTGPASPAGPAFAHPSQIPKCPLRYRPVFPHPDPKSQIQRPSAAKDGVRHCSLLTIEEALSSETSRRAAMNSRKIAFRSHHRTLEAVFAACTAELDWHRVGKRVERLFLLRGTEILLADAVVDGCVLVASSGATYHPPEAVATAIASSRSAVHTKSPERNRSPLARVTTASAGSTSRPIVIRVYVNGEYGDVNGDLFPYRTVTVRPTYKTMSSLYTLLARELQWNLSSRKVEVLYSSRGEEITALHEIQDGASVVASSGDRFIIPRVSSIIHRENQQQDSTPAAGHGSQSGSKRTSPIRQRSPIRGAGGGGGPSAVSSSQARATKLLQEIRRVEQSKNGTRRPL